MNKLDNIRTVASTIYKENRKFLKSWLTQMNVYFMLHANQFLSETFKILFATFYPKEAAFDWVQSRVKNYSINPKSERKSETSQIFYSFSNMIVVIKKAFEESNEDKVNKRKLLILRQQKSMTIYAAQFKTLTYKTNWKDSALKAHFYKKLSDRVKNAMMTIEESKILTDTIELVTRINTRQYERYIDKQTNNKTESVKKQFREDSMKLDVIETKKLRIKTCYSCEKTEHLKRNCSFKKTTKIIEHWLKMTEKSLRNTVKNHITLNWTVCYNDNCSIHLSNKKESEWYFKKSRQSRRNKRPMMKVESHHMKKSLTAAFRIEIRKQQIMTLINEERENKITTQLCETIKEYIQNCFKKDNRVTQVEVKTKHDLVEITDFIIISSFKKYIILKNEWKKSLSETLVLKSNVEKKIKFQTIHLLTYKNLLYTKLIESSTINYKDIQNIDQIFKKKNNVWATKVWTKDESLFQKMTTKQNKDQKRIIQTWKEYI